MPDRPSSSANNSAKRISSLRRQRLNDLQGDQRYRILSQWSQEALRQETDQSGLTLLDASFGEEPSRRDLPPVRHTHHNGLYPGWLPESASSNSLHVNDSGDVEAHRRVTEDILTMKAPPRVHTRDTSGRGALRSKPSHRTRSQSRTPSLVFFTVGDDVSERGEAMLYHLADDPYSHGPYSSTEQSVIDTWSSGVQTGRGHWEDSEEDSPCDESF
ncbi:hypothetical protein BV25DRAFT_1163231 [Artomyces pyxidatus]|uniref:Uncharacterized protein n=1 Tax=Artomyces pyxidatus TaxID=48021 RepID=A0ACB8STI6_9AGAM|nr:hypothetical protein BV25DRAFT_1163231 [Artomyces pyxidatus]